MKPQPSCAHSVTQNFHWMIRGNWTENKNQNREASIFKRSQNKKLNIFCEYSSENSWILQIPSRNPSTHNFFAIARLPPNKRDNRRAKSRWTFTDKKPNIKTPRENKRLRSLWMRHLRHSKTQRCPQSDTQI